MKFENIPYTYLIGWPKLGKWYYGVRYAKNCTPSDLWVTYKTSSKIVHDFILKHGDPTVRQVRKIYKNRENAIQLAQLLENRVLKKLNVTKNPKWLNGHDSKSFDPSLVPKGDQHWTRQDTEKARQWRDRSGWKSKGGSSVDTAPKGNKHWTNQKTDSAIKHYERMNGKNNPNNLAEVKEKKSNYLKNNNPVNIPGVREKISKTLTGKKRPRKICEFCNKDVADSVYTRYHSNKCKHKIYTKIE